MKTFISSAIILGLSFTLLVSNRSAANNAPSTSRSNSDVAQNTSGEEFIARGTEPFWNMTVSKRGIVYTSPEVKKLTFAYVNPLKAAGRPEDLVRVYPLKGKNNNMLIIKKDNKCSDGMSDKIYPYSATLILGNTVFEGCAEKR